MDELTDKLVSTVSNERRKAIEQLMLHPSIARVLAVPLVLATGYEDETSELADNILEQIGAPRSEDALPIVELLHHSSGRVASWAATLLGRLGQADLPTVKALGEVIANGAEMHVKQQAAWALGRIGPGAVDVVETLNAATESDDLRLARIARRAIKHIDAV
jgi:HEAT repeat protein